MASGLIDPAGMLVALSGGPDSTALLLGLLEAGIPVAAAHFDHALRPGSVAEAEKVAALCSRLGIRLLSGRRAEPLAAGSVQAAARVARYHFFEGALSASGLRTAALGHTADDLVESVLLNLLRGAGLAGMRGMPQRRGPFVRPLLGCWRTEVERFLAERGVEPIRDPSNADLRFARVRVRLQLLPRLEADRPGLSRRVHRAALRASVLQAELEAAVAAFGKADADASQGRRLAGLVGLSPAVRAEVLRGLHASVTGHRPSLERRHLAALERLLAVGRSGDSIDLPGGIRAHRGYEALEMSTGGRVDPGGAMLATRACTGCETLGAAHFPPGIELVLGSRRPGLRMRPLPAGRTRKLQDLLVDAKVPRHLRDDLPLVFAGGLLAWVPGVARDARLTIPRGAAGIHAEVVRPGNPLLESSHQLKESASQ